MKDTEFIWLVNFANSRLGTAALADALGVSKPTVERWVFGHNLAHAAMRSGIRAAIVVELSRIGVTIGLGR